MAVDKDPFDFTGSLGSFRSYHDPVTGKRILSRKGGFHDGTVQERS